MFGVRMCGGLGSLVVVLSCCVPPGGSRVGRGWVAGVPAPFLVAVAWVLSNFAFGRGLGLEN